VGVKVELQLDRFEDKFMEAIGKELVKAGMIFRRNLSTVLRTTGKGTQGKKAKWGETNGKYWHKKAVPAVHSPAGSKIPYNVTGTLARSWMSSSSSRRTNTTISVAVGTNVMYAKWLVVKTGKGRRNYLDGRLAWQRKTKEMMLKRLDVKRMIKTAVRSLKK
tara:strand:- start:73 stop:558 length:486 start_codon:yes stop_codon:yes gene_type:complete